jgi:hypothetical protein
MQKSWRCQYYFQKYIPLQLINLIAEFLLMQIHLISTATRLGEFSPIGWLFTLGSIFKLHNQATFLGYFSPRLWLRIIYDKRRGGLHFGRFFHKLVEAMAKALQRRTEIYGNDKRSNGRRIAYVQFQKLD